MSKNKSVSAIYADGLSKPKSTIRIDKKDYPKIKELNVDDEITFVIKAKVVEISKDTYMENPEISARLEIQSLKEQ